jgi:hypothetical protein
MQSKTDQMIIYRVIKSRKMECTGHAALMGDTVKCIQDFG